MAKKAIFSYNEDLNILIVIARENDDSNHGILIESIFMDRKIIQILI